MEYVILPFLFIRSQSAKGRSLSSALVAVRLHIVSYLLHNDFQILDAQAHIFSKLHYEHFSK